MKGFLAGVFVTAPITGLVMFLWLGQNHTAQVQHERAVTELRLDDEKFDREFDRLTRDARDPATRRRMAERKKRIEKLRAELADLDRAARADLLQSKKDAEDARAALMQAPPPSLPGEGDLPDPGDPGKP